MDLEEKATSVKNVTNSGQNTYDNPAFEDGEKGTHKQENSSKELSNEKEDPGNPVIRCIVKPLDLIRDCFTEYAHDIKILLLVLLAIGYTAYMIAALVINFQRAIPLLVIFCLVAFFGIYSYLRRRAGDAVWEGFKPVYDFINIHFIVVKWIFISIVVILLITWIAVDTSKRPNQLISMAGYILIVIILFLTSKYPGKVNWRPVFWGLGIQLCMGLFILRTQVGFDIFNWLGFIVQTFINFVDAGIALVFGDLWYQHYFAFKVLPIIMYFSSVIAVLQYLGAMQWLVLKMAWLMQFSMGTSATESLCAAGNIFLGMTEAPLMIRPYIKDLTLSEMHAIMTAGFGTVAGSVLGAYLGFGIEAYYLIPAAVMASPCALAVSKLMYPETEISKFRKRSDLKLEPSNQRNVIEAAFVGASSSIEIVLNIAATLIAFVTILAAINAGLSWYGGMLDFPQLSFELICSYIFMPFTFMMGIEYADCFKCAELLGIMIFLNEFVAYEKLGEMIKSRNTGTIPRIGDDGSVQWISERSEAIVTYMLCGFANFAAVGIALGGLGAMCPERRSDMSKIVLRALVGGICVNIMSACIAGFLYVPPPANCTLIFSYDYWNATVLSGVAECCGIEIKNTSSNIACRCCDDASWPDDTYNFTCTGNELCP